MSRKLSFLPYALLSGGAFLCGLLLLFVMLWQGEALELSGRWFYVVLLPLGLSVAAFLFGCLKSYAIYKGQTLGGVLELGGPLVAFLLVVLLGFLLPEPVADFAVTLRVIRDDAPDTLQTTGQIFLDLGGDRREATLSHKGEAHFLEIPGRFRGQTVTLGIQNMPAIALSQRELTLQPGGMTIHVQGKPALFHGYVQDEQGRVVAAATVSLLGKTTLSQDNGYFQLELTRAEVEKDEHPQLRITAPNFQPYTVHVVADGGEIHAQLQAEKPPVKTAIRRQP